MTASSTEADTGRRLKALEEAIYNLQRERRPADDTLDNVKTGTVAGFLSSSVPQGWLLLAGQTITAADFPALAAFLSSHGLSLTLPDYVDRVPIGAGNLYAVTATGGGADAVVVSHTHSGPSHTHPTGHHASAAEAAGFGLTASASFTDRVRVDGSGDVSGAGGTAATGATGGSGTGANLPPWRGLYWMIRT